MLAVAGKETRKWLRPGKSPSCKACSKVMPSLRSSLLILWNGIILNSCCHVWAILTELLNLGMSALSQAVRHLNVPLPKTWGTGEAACVRHLTNSRSFSVLPFRQNHHQWEARLVTTGLPMPCQTSALEPHWENDNLIMRTDWLESLSIWECVRDS